MLLHLILKLEFIVSDDSLGHKSNREACTMESQKRGTVVCNLLFMFVSGG